MRCLREAQLPQCAQKASRTWRSQPSDFGETCKQHLSVLRSSTGSSSAISLQATRQHAAASWSWSFDMQQPHVCALCIEIQAECQGAYWSNRATRGSDLVSSQAWRTLVSQGPS